MMGAPELTAFEHRFGLEPGEGDLVLEILDAAMGGGDRDTTVRNLLSALRDDRPLAQGLGLPAGASEVLYARATQWFGVGRPERAEPLFRILCLIEGGSADFWVGHGVCLHLTDRVEAARLAFETAARLRPDWALPYVHLAAVALRDRRGEQARRALERFRSLADDSVPDALHEEARRLSAMIDAGAERRA